MSQTPVNQLYYGIKPFLPWRLRMAVRRWVARRKRRRCGEVWPIHRDSGHAPQGWPGWPGRAKFAFVLTHDVEGQRGVARCRQLAELELELGFRSSFNFVPEGQYETPETLRHWLCQHGFEVGVHDLNHDGWLYRSRAAFKRKALRINHYLRAWNACGFRSGFMHRNYDWLHDLEILYDASAFDTDPFEPQPDGVHSIFPISVSSNDLSLPARARPEYIELPYTLAQDSTLFLLFRETDIDIWKRKLDWIAECGGMALLCVHPDYVQFPGDSPALSTFPAAWYAEFLAHVRNRYAGSYWSVLPRQVANYARTVGCRDEFESLPPGRIGSSRVENARDDGASAAGAA